MSPRHALAPLAVLTASLALGVDAPSTRPVEDRLQDELRTIVAGLNDAELPTTQPNLTPEARRQSALDEANDLLKTPYPKGVPITWRTGTETELRDFSKKCLDVINDFNLKPSAVTEKLIAADKKKPLTGDRLRLHAALLGGSVGKLVNAMQKSTPAK